MIIRRSVNYDFPLDIVVCGAERLTVEGLDKAQEDYSVATGLLRRRKIPANSICFHCQQAGEKYLKALLQERDLRFGRTHDLEELLRLAGQKAPRLLSLAGDLRLLSDYSVRYRYPGFDATPYQARRAVQAARRVRVSLLAMLTSEQRERR